MSSLKKRSGHAAAEKAALNYISDVTNRGGHIFRRVLEEDVGIDAHIEICPSSNEPSGFVVAVQVKSGESYIHAETGSNFTFYPTAKDLRYWHSYVLPVYLVIYRPERGIAYWLDIKEVCAGGRFEDMLARVRPRKFVFKKSNVFSENFFSHLLRADLEQQRLHNELLTAVFSAKIDLSGPALPVHIRQLISKLDATTAAALLRYLGSRRNECAALITKKGKHKADEVDNYINDVAHALRSRVFETEGTGFVLLPFEQIAVRDASANEIEAIIPTNRYLVLKGHRLFADRGLMNEMLLVAFDDWPVNEERFGALWIPLTERLGLVFGGSYDMDFYDPRAAATFFTPDYCFQYEFETFLDTGHELSLFDWCRISARVPKSKESADTHLWISVGPDRIKVYYEWEPAIYWYLHCVKAIRTGEPWLGMYDYVLEMEFEVASDEARAEFIRQVKAAKCLAELPFMTDRMKDEIESGMQWGEKHYGKKETPH